MRPISPFQPTLEPEKLKPEEALITSHAFPVQDFSGLVGQEKDDTPLYRHWYFTGLQPNTTQTVFTDSGWPDYWVIYVMPSWSATPGQYGPCLVRFYQSQLIGIGGEPEFVLAGGGYARIPGANEYMSFVVATAVTPSWANVGLIAVRKTEIEVMVYPGVA